MGVRCKSKDNEALKQKLLSKKYSQKNEKIEYSMEFMDFDDIYEATAKSCQQFTS